MRRAVTVAAVILVLAGCSPTPQQAVDPAPPPTAAQPVSASAAAPAPARQLVAEDVQITVRETSKQCFGSAGCNIEFTLEVAADTSLIPPGTQYAVSYDLHGLKDDQTGTITLKDDGTFDQPSSGFGQKAKSSTKVTATITYLHKVR
jgi:hypothetical protein